MTIYRLLDIYNKNTSDENKANYAKMLPFLLRFIMKHTIIEISLKLIKEIPQNVRNNTEVIANNFSNAA